MRKEFSGIVLKAIRSFGKWIILIFGGFAGYIVIILQVVKPSNVWLASAEILIPPIGAFLFLFIYHILRRVSELSGSLDDRQSKIEELSANLDAAMHSIGIMEHKVRSVGGGIVQNIVDIRTELDIDGTWRRNSHIEIEVTQGILNNLYHYNSTAIGKGLFFQGYTFSFKEVYCEPGSRITCDIVKRPDEASPNQIDINLTFSPPLVEGKKAVYEYFQSYKGITSMTREEADKAKLARNIFSNECVEIDGYRILCETKRIFRQIIFPTRYDISSPGIAVFYRGNRISDEEDKARQYFSAKFLNNCWILEWEFTDPKLWHTYFFLWLPPREEEYKALIAK